jgi:parallel beta-helix repeat protein
MKRKLSAVVIFAAVAMLAWAASAGAVDGTIEINQAKVLAGSGFPYKITTGGSYRLTGNLMTPVGIDGIDVTAAGVTIDLNGFSITGSLLSGTQTGINAGQDDVTVENGTVTAFRGTGVQVGKFGIVRNVHADANGTIGIQGGLNSVIEGCTANNSSTGISCSGVCLISGNTANGNVNDGIDCSANACVISNNTANANGGNGIDCVGSGCLISGNTAFNNSIGISAIDATTGYGGNVLKNSTNISLGTSLGAKNTNLCTTGGVTSAC